MALDAVRGYLALAGGLTEVTRAKAVAQAKAILADDSLAPLVAGGAKAQSQVQALAEEIVAAGRANREVVVHLVKAEVEKAMATVGGLGRDDIKALRVSLDRLERRIAVLESKDASATAAKRSSKKTTARKTTAKKTTAKKTAAHAATTTGEATPGGNASAAPTPTATAEAGE